MYAATGGVTGSFRNGIKRDAMVTIHLAEPKSGGVT
jgi:hypothetical protein